ncbi:MAG TPA: acyltransferase [Chryseosolibacter sp.]|nr:acyltransferase [Chryseosolibacter sp.]
MEKRIYFKNLNALRFFAAAAVIFHHIEQYKFLSGYSNVWGNTAVDALGHKAVSFFFVLSGFLITFLLLEEDKRSGEINVRNFYIRRILRIWPLYYLIVFLCLFVMPYLFDLSIMGSQLLEKNFWLTAGLLLLVLPNVMRTISPNLIGGNQLWSIGVEEQFYLVWPVLVKWFRTSLPVFLIAFLGIKALLTIGLEFAVAGYNTLVMQKLLRIWILLQVEQMAIGAIGAWVLFAHKEKFLAVIYSRAAFILSLIAVVTLFILPLHHWWINYAEALAFVILIMNLSTNPRIKISMETPLLNSLGNISYGIYMYHTLCITISLFALRYLRIDRFDPVLFNVMLYALSIVSTIFVSSLSYEFFEKRFLDLKERFMVVKSGQKQAASATTVSSPAPEPTTMLDAPKMFVYWLAAVSKMLYRKVF